MILPAIFSGDKRAKTDFGPIVAIGFVVGLSIGPRIHGPR